MTATAAGMLASVAVLAVFGSLVRWPTVDLLGPEAATRLESHRSNAFERIGRWPLVRHIPVSAGASARAEGAGLRWDPRTVVGSKVVAVGATIAVLGGVLGPVVLPLGFVAWRVPDLVLARMARRTTRAADREIPILLDLLAVATSAGLPPQLAFRRAVEGAEGPLADALREVVDATDLGGRWRDELKAAGDRLGLADLRRLIGALTRTEAVGSSLSQEISRLAADVREVRGAAAAQRARTAPVKMLFPLVFLVLPAFLLLTVVPVLLTTVRSIA